MPEKIRSTVSISPARLHRGAFVDVMALDEPFLAATLLRCIRSRGGNGQSARMIASCHGGPYSKRRKGQGSGALVLGVEDNFDAKEGVFVRQSYPVRSGEGL